MLEVGKVRNMPEAAAMGAPVTCSACGKPSFDDPEMKRISFGKKEDASRVCLCSECANHLQGILALMI